MDTLRACAKALMKAGKFEDAADVWHKCILTGPELGKDDCYHKRGICFLQAKRFSEALEVFGELVDQFPKYPGGRRALERARLHARIYDEFPLFGDIATTPRQNWSKITDNFRRPTKASADFVKQEPIHCFWAEGDLTEIAYASLMTFLRAGHDVRLYSYTPDNLSVARKSNLSIRSADKVLARDFYEKCKASAGIQYFSDIFRYAVLHQNGGWWIDLDVLLVRPLDIASPYLFCTQYRGEFVVGNVLKAPIGSNHMIRLFDESVRAIEEGNTDYGEAGPRLLSRYIFSQENEELKKYLLPPVFFNGINWDEIEHLVNVSELAYDVLADPRTYGVHLWNKMWSINGYSISDAAHRSIVGLLAREWR